MLGELLGRGGMAEVFSGFVLGSHGFQKPVAIKRLLPELANDHVFVERLIGEAKLLVGMQHGNIVSVLDLARDGDDVFLVMEYVDGPSLRQLLKARGPRLLPLGVASYIVQSAAAGLEFAHGRQGGAIIHADISPSNLLLTTSGEVRVADFGIARREGGLVGVVEGKWAYMAPEQARGEVLTPRSDVFALGVVLYELITGQHPLGRQVSAEERDSGPIRVIPARVVNPAVPPGLDAICMRALSENARDRYPSMQSLIDAIMDERFTNQYREGANDLAQAIRAITPGAAPRTAGPRTQITDRPVTIVTRSLISQPARASSTQLPSQLAYQSPAPTTGQPDADTLDAETGELKVADPTRVITNPRASSQLVASNTAVMIPPSGAQTLQMQMSDLTPALLSPSMLPPPAGMSSPELASVHGAGTTVTGSHLVDMRDARGGTRWTAAVLGVAAVLGIGAALVIQLAPTPEIARSSAAATPDERVPAPAPEAEAEPEPLPPAPTVHEPTVPAVAEATPAPAAIVSPAHAPAPAPKRTARARTAPAAAKRGAGEAVLRVSTYNGVWAVVSVGNQKQEIPNAKFKLAPGTYTVRLKNTDLAITRTCSIMLEDGQVRTLRVELEEGICDPGR